MIEKLETFLSLTKCMESELLHRGIIVLVIHWFNKHLGVKILNPVLFVLYLARLQFTSFLLLKSYSGNLVLSNATNDIF